MGMCLIMRLFLVKKRVVVRLLSFFTMWVVTYNGVIVVLKIVMDKGSSKEPR